MNEKWSITKENNYNLPSQSEVNFRFEKFLNYWETLAPDLKAWLLEYPRYAAALAAVAMGLRPAFAPHHPLSEWKGHLPEGVDCTDAETDGSKMIFYSPDAVQRLIESFPVIFSDIDVETAVASFTTAAGMEQAMRTGLMLGYPVDAVQNYARCFLLNRHIAPDFYEPDSKLTAREREALKAHKGLEGAEPRPGDEDILRGLIDRNVPADLIGETDIRYFLTRQTRQVPGFSGFATAVPASDRDEAYIAEITQKFIDSGAQAWFEQVQAGPEL